jgi:hypothetical protein
VGCRNALRDAPHATGDLAFRIEALALVERFEVVCASWAFATDAERSVARGQKRSVVQCVAGGLEERLDLDEVHDERRVAERQMQLQLCVIVVAVKWLAWPVRGEEGVC